MLLYFIRHGESEANVRHEFSNGLNKHPLTGLGVQQSQELAEKMKDSPLRAVYSSPILRAVQTANILAAPHGLTVEIADALREYDVGVLEGRADAEAWQFFEQVNQDWLGNINRNIPLPGGESYQDVEKRFMPFLREILIRHASPPGQHIAFIGHGGTYRLMLPLVIRNLTSHIMLEKGMRNTGVIMAESESGQFPLRLVRWDDEIFSE